MAVKLFIVLSLAVVAVSSAGLLETLLSWDLPETEARSSTPKSECICQTSGCLCCVDLNMTSPINLERSACVNIKQKEQNVSLNLSYGDYSDQNATFGIEEAAKEPTCMNLMMDFAQLCARFTSMNRSESGHDGCLVIETLLIQSAAATFPIGCFNFEKGVRKIPDPVKNETEIPAENTENGQEDEEETGLNTDDILAAVSAGAEQGIAFISQWLSENLNTRLNVTSNKKDTVESNARQETISISPTSRSGRSMLDVYPSHEERSDERFKQLLSAQDNILKESARIGHSDGGRTTFIYAQSSENSQNRKDIMPAVPRESRRGGRAYNIHQHINEV